MSGADTGLLAAISVSGHTIEIDTRKGLIQTQLLSKAPIFSVVYLSSYITIKAFFGKKRSFSLRSNVHSSSALLSKLKNYSEI